MHSNQEKSARPRTARDHILAACILCYVFIGIASILPVPLLGQKVADLFAPIGNFFRVRQAWGVFGPEVPKWTSTMYGVVTFADGTWGLWPFPVMKQLGVRQKEEAEFFRKWEDDNLPADFGAPARPEAAKFIARRFSNATNPPAYVSLHLDEQPIAGPDGKKQAPSYEPTLYVLKVGEEDMK